MTVKGQNEAYYLKIKNSAICCVLHVDDGHYGGHVYHTELLMEFAPESEFSLMNPNMEKVAIADPEFFEKARRVIVKIFRKQITSTITSFSRIINSYRRYREVLNAAEQHKSLIHKPIKI